MLSINDQILDLSSQSEMTGRLRVGIPTGDAEGAVLHLIEKFLADHPGLQVQIRNEPSDTLLREFRRGEFDLVVASTDEEQPTRPRCSWLEQSAWGMASPTVVPADGPIPLVLLGEGSLTRRMSFRALKEAGQPYEVVYVGKSYASLIEAAAAGLGVVCWAKHRLEATGLHVVDRTARLPKLVDMNFAIYIGEGWEGSALDDLADRIAAVVRPSAEAKSAVRSAGGR